MNERRGERVILVGVAKKTRDDRLDSSLEELHRLTETAGGVVVETLSQRLERFDPRTMIGAGKVAEVGEAVRRHRVRTVIFDEDLSPAQQNNLEKEVKAKIIDRTRLILDIFAQRARTREGELQVELAQLSYMLPRLTGSWRGFSQQVGGIGTRGPGERKLEYERRHIRLRIKYLQQAIAKVKQERSIQRDRRRSVPVPQVAIIGYTNVGKSTLLNTLTKSEAVYADDKLFATLDPTSRRVKLPEGGWAVFTDTVGFIQKLPTTLVAAFRATLEEVALADCLIHVTDASSADRAAQTKAVETILSELGADALPRIEAVNKADLLPDSERRRLRQESSRAVFISARKKEGIEEMLTRVQDSLHERWMLRELDLDASRSRLIPEAYRCAQVLKQSAHDGKIRLSLRITPENWSRLKARLSTA
ncbi:MAG: GTPase HflX [Elusimicrobia bacterium]|nr:GTPase HflX [Elusimicrobiota bacterium]